MLFGKGARQPLMVVAHYADGTEEEVTAKSQFTSGKAAVVTVDEHGVMEAQANGGAIIRATYQGLQASTTALAVSRDV